MRRIVPVLAVLALLAVSCGDGGSTDANGQPRDLTGTSGPDAALLGAEGDTSSTSEGETTTSEDTTTTTEETTTTLPPALCPLPQPLPRGVVFDRGLVRLHRATAAFAESAGRLGDALKASDDFSPGWGAREPVASAFYRMQSDLYTLASLLERTYAAAGATYSPGAGWTFPDGAYPLAALAEPWAEIPGFQAVSLTGFFEMATGADALAFFEGGGGCGLVAAFSTAMDQAAAGSGG